MRRLVSKIYNDDARLAIAIFLLALAPRAGLVFYFGGTDPVFTDFSYQTMAENYAEGRGLGMPDVYAGAGRIYVRAFRPPLFPFLWGLVYPWTQGWYLPVRLAHAILSSLTCVLVLFAGQRLLNRASGTTGALLTAFFPSQIWHGVNLMTEPLFAFFLTALILLLLRLNQTASAPTAFAAGLSAGLGVLSRSALVGFVPLAALWLLCALPRKKWLVLLFVAGFLCAMSPWWVRNWRVFHRFVATTTDGGHGFLIGNNDRTLSDPRGVYVPEDWSFAGDAIHDELALRNRLYEKGLEYLRSHPAVWPRLALDKACRLWRMYPHTDFVDVRHAVIYGISNFIVFPFIIAGAALSFFALPANRMRFSLVYLLVVFMTGIHMVYIAVMRYREPFMPLLLCFAGYAVTAALTRRAPAE